MSYDPTNWRTGDLITAVKMNNIEEGIVNVEETTTDRIDDQDSVIAELGQTVDTRLDDQDDAITAISDSVDGRIDTQDDAIVTISAQLGARVTAQDAAIRALSYSVENRLDDQEDEIAIVRQQVASPFVIAATASQMTDHDKAYVYVGSESGYVTGNWYYWEGSSWVSGGSAVDPTLSISGAPADAKATGDMFDTCARIDGSYDAMTVGNAEQLVSTVYTEDSVPYAFRTLGGAADIGDREQDTITGGTVNWNQLLQNGNFESTSGWTTGNASISVADNICTMTASASNSRAQIRHNIALGAFANHVYLAFATVKPAVNTTNTTLRIYNATASAVIFEKLVSITANTKVTIASIGKATEDVAQGYFRIYLYGSTSETTTGGDIYEFSNVNVFDLTAMFGTAIADYIYSVEQATAGAGVALAKRWGNIIKPYYPYSAGGLISVEGLQSHDMTGFNAWDEVWELGGIDNSTGQDTSVQTVIRARNYNPCLPNTNYCATKPNAAISCYFYWYDYNKNFISSASTGNTSPYYVRTSPENARYFRITYGSNNNPVTTYSGGICINISHDGSRNGEYEPYEKHSYPLDSSLTLRGIPRLNAANELYYDGDRYLPDGTVERRYAELTGQSGAVGDAISLTGVAPNTTDIVTSAGHLADVGTLSGDTLTLTVALSNASIVYPLAEPATESATPYAENQYVDDWGTEEYVSTATDYVIPVGHETKYPSNLRDKLQHLPSLSANGDGTYAIQQTGSQMSLVHLPAVLPALPGENGSYVLKATVTSGTATLTWVAE